MKMTEQTKDLQQRAEALSRLALDLALADRARLQALNAELVAALQFLINWNDDGGFPGDRRVKMIAAARAALSKAKES
jgi:hypothetical protein